MKIETILDHIDNGHMALPEFQRGYVWNRNQVRQLFDSLYRGYPIGGLLVWETESDSASHRGEAHLAPGMVKLLLDGQQRITSLYGVRRGRPPKFFDGNSKAFTDLYFHLGEELFAFYQPLKMKTDPLWIDVSKLTQEGMGSHISKFSQSPEHTDHVGKYAERLQRLLSIMQVDLHVEEMTGKSLDVVVDIFNRANSGGTKLSKGDLALAKVCKDLPETRDKMKAEIAQWEESGFKFTLDWFLRSINTVLTGEANFSHLLGQNTEEIKDGLARATKAINTLLNMIGGRLGLDHDRVLFGRFAIPVMARFLDQHHGPLDERERDKLLFWYVQAAMWGRFSGSTETYIDQDLEAIKDTSEGPLGLDNLIEKLRLSHSGLRVEPAHFSGWSLNTRFYPVLYMLTRTGEARDWGTGLPLKAEMLGRMSSLDVHHIFPKSQLSKHGHDKTQVNAVANFCFLTKDTNITISNDLPEKYFPEVEARHPGALASQWIPQDQNLWRMENYQDFLEARRMLLAEEANRILAGLLHKDSRWLKEITETDTGPMPPSAARITDRMTGEEEQICEELNRWVAEQGLPLGEADYGFQDSDTGEEQAVFDLAWPNGIQHGLSQPVAFLFNETAEVISLANSAGFRCFTNPANFKKYVETEVLADQEAL